MSNAIPNANNNAASATAAMIAETLGYLSTHYLKLEQLAAACALTPDRVCELIEARRMPPHSHEIQLELNVNTSLWGRQSQQATLRYYPRSLVKWATDAEDRTQQMPLAEVAIAMTKRFSEELRAALRSVKGAQITNPQCFDTNGFLIEPEFMTWCAVRIK